MALALCSSSIDRVRSSHRPPSFTVEAIHPNSTARSPTIMFRRHPPSGAPYSVYPSSLSTLYLGYALWYPEPHDTGEPQIGDVGYIHEGALVRLFNLNASKPEHQVTFWDVPFEPAMSLPKGVFGKLDTRRSLPANHYRSHGVHKSELSGAVNV